MNGALIAPDAQFAFIAPESDPKDLSLVCSSPEFPDELPGDSIPCAY